MCTFMQNPSKCELATLIEAAQAWTGHYEMFLNSHVLQFQAAFVFSMAMTLARFP